MRKMQRKQRRMPLRMRWRWRKRMRTRRSPRPRRWVALVSCYPPMPKENEEADGQSDNPEAALIWCVCVCV